MSWPSLKKLEKLEQAEARRLIVGGHARSEEMLPKFRSQFVNTLMKANPSDVIIQQVHLKDKTFILVGEKHLSTESKEGLANAIKEAYKSESVTVFVEALSDTERIESYNSVIQAIGSKSILPLINENSLLVRLSDLGIPVFVGRPEEINNGMLIEPAALINITSQVLKCNISTETLTTALALACEISSGAVYMLNKMVQSGAIHHSLKDTVFTQLTKPMAKLIQMQVWKTLRLQDLPEFLEGMNDVIASPHFVSDAAFATTFIGANTNPFVVIVGGIAHIRKISEYLKILPPVTMPTSLAP